MAAIIIMQKLISVQSNTDIPLEYRNTPIGKLFEYHNLNRPYDEYQNADLLIGMCMDNRKNLTLPDNFAFVIRAGGANLRYSEFKMSYAISIAGVKHMALIGHSNCGMVNLISRKEQFVEGLVETAGWKKEDAESHFDELAPKFEIGDEKKFLIREAQRLRPKYPKIVIVPMLYLVEDNKLYLIEDE